MKTNKIKNMLNNMRALISDWQLLKGSALISLGTVIARILGFAFSIVLASVFTPGDYGAIQYSITVASVVGIVSQPIGQHVFARFVGKYLYDQEKLNRIVSHIVVLMVIILLLTLLIAAPFLNTINQLSIGILVIFLGETLFYAYWGLASGTQSAKKLTAVYLGSNLIQLVLVFLAFHVFNSRSTMLALVIYGSSYILPIVILQKYFPLPVKVVAISFDRQYFKEILNFSFPKLISHASYIGYRSLDVFLLKYFSTPEELGAYLLTRTIVSVFLFVPRGISSLLMPKIASGEDLEAKRSLNQMVVISLVINFVIFAFYIIFHDWAISKVFGSDYKLDLLASVIMGLTAILVGLYDLLNSYSVGKGHPATETYGYLISVLLIFVLGVLLIPSMHSFGASLAKMVGILGAFVPYILMQKNDKAENIFLEETI